MEIPEKKEVESKGVNPQGVVEPLSASADREAEERDRQAGELKAGLHPLKVSCFRFILRSW